MSTPFKEFLAEELKDPEFAAAYASELATSEYSFILTPSPIAGIGVFATHDTPKDTVLRLFADGDERTLASVPKPFDQYSVQDITGLSLCCPADFGRMSIGWYLNHSDNPSAGGGESEDWIALRDIKAGEEITIDYDTLEPQNAEDWQRKLRAARIARYVNRLADDSGLK